MSQALGWAPIFYLPSDLLYNINKFLSSCDMLPAESNLIISVR